MHLIIESAKVRMDSEGRYSLNDLHKAAGGRPDQQPAFFMRRKETDGLIQAIANSANMQSLKTTVNPVVSVGGRNGGTYVCKQLVYAYAMWVSHEFNLMVIDAFDALVTGKLADAERIASRQAARLEAPFMTDALKHHRQIRGKQVAHYHYSNEFDLVNRVALGKSAKEFRIAHNIGADDPIRDHLTKLEIACVQALQRANTAMLDMGMEFDDRKVALHKIYVTRHAAGLLDEVKRIEA